MSCKPAPTGVAHLDGKPLGWECNVGVAEERNEALKHVEHAENRHHGAGKHDPADPAVTSG